MIFHICNLTCDKYHDFNSFIPYGDVMQHNGLTRTAAATVLGSAGLSSAGSTRNAAACSGSVALDSDSPARTAAVAVSSSVRLRRGCPTRSAILGLIIPALVLSLVLFGFSVAAPPEAPGTDNGPAQRSESNKADETEIDPAAAVTPEAENQQAPCDSGGISTFPNQPAETEAVKPAITFADDVGRSIRDEAGKMRSELTDRAKPLFEREPVGFDGETISRAIRDAAGLPATLPGFIDSLREQGRILGITGSVIILLFLGLVSYSIFGRRRILAAAGSLVDPLADKLPEFAARLIRSLVLVAVVSLIPLLLLGLFSLSVALTGYEAAWFLLVGKLLKIWVAGALMIRLLREALTRGLLPVSPAHGKRIFRLAYMIILYIMLIVALYNATAALPVSDDYIALARFLISLSIVLAITPLLAKKRTLLELLPELPYGSYRIFRTGIDHLYYPLISATILTGFLWCAGYTRLCSILWLRSWAVLGVFIGVMIVYHLLRQPLDFWFDKTGAGDERARILYKSARRILMYVAGAAMILPILRLTGLGEPLLRLVSLPFLQLSGQDLSPRTFLQAFLILYCVLLASRLLRAWLDYSVYPSFGVEEGLGYAINTFIAYMSFTIGILAALRAVGLDFRVLMVFAGAAGIGIGLGMQSLAANLISGFIIVFGRKVRKGDWLQVGETIGQVREVTLRATKLRTRDNIEYLVPNSQLTAETIVNYTLSDPLIRVHIPLGVSYKSNPEEVSRIATEAAVRNPNVDRRHKPEIWFTGYGDSSIDFELLAWMDIRKLSRDELRSELYFEIFSALADAGIEIPFPQRDIHIKKG